MELDYFPRTGPDALPAVRAPLVDDPDLRFKQFNGIFRTHAHAATTKVAFARNNMDH